MAADDASPRELAETLAWCVGRDSPTGRRVLDIRPASRTLLSASAGEEAALNITAGPPEDLSPFDTTLPNRWITASVPWCFDAAEIERLKAGFVPSQMEDKWLILARQLECVLRVSLLRSWTRELLFVLEVPHEGELRLHHSRNLLLPIETCRAVLDGYLLRRLCVVPAPRDIGTDKLALMQYAIAVAGRKADFVEPATSRTWFVTMHDPGIRRDQDNPRAVERMLARDVMDEAMGARFELGHHRLVKTVAAMLMPDPAPGVGRGFLPAQDAGIDHEELALLRGWLDEISRMSEGRLRRLGTGLWMDDEPAVVTPLDSFEAVPASRWLVWGRGLAPHKLGIRTPPRAADLACVREHDPRFSLSQTGWIARFDGTGAGLLEALQGEDSVRGWLHVGTRDSLPVDPPESPPDPNHPIPWQLAVSGTRPPSARSYWVIPGKLAGGAYPPVEANQVYGAGRVEELLYSGIRTFINLVEEQERNNQGKPFTPYADHARKLTEAWGEQVTCLRFPTRDLSIPSVDQMGGILDAIDLSLAANRSVFVHCYGGVGRTGTVIGCWLRRHGKASANDVLDVLHDLRQADEACRHRRAPETAEQFAMVKSWEVGR